MISLGCHSCLGANLGVFGLGEALLQGVWRIRDSQPQGIVDQLGLDRGGGGKGVAVGLADVLEDRALPVQLRVSVWGGHSLKSLASEDHRVRQDLEEFSTMASCVLRASALTASISFRRPSRHISSRLSVARTYMPRYIYSIWV